MATSPSHQPPERVFNPENPGALQRLFRTVARAESVEELRTNFIPAASAYFAACRAALMLFSEYPLSEMRPEIRDNPVVQYLFERHAAVHEAVVLRPEDWTVLCPWADHGHVLAGPVVMDGELIAALALTRARDEAAFDAAALADASALSLHLSSWFTRRQWEADDDMLTPREREIAGLVAEGLTNARIGARLFISSETVKAALSRMFRKTGTASRAQLAARYGRRSAELRQVEERP